MLREKANNLAMMIESFSGEIFIGSIVLLGIYIFLRVKKINLIYLLDVYVLITFLFIIGIIITPHRYYWFTYFVVVFLDSINKY